MVSSFNLNCGSEEPLKELRKAFLGAMSATALFFLETDKTPAAH
jgi:hypothetical protein